MRWGIFLIMVVAVAGFTALLVIGGFDRIMTGVAAVGWGLALVVLIRLLALGLATLGWRAAMGAPVAARPLLRLFGLRLIREAINALLPVGQVGGDLIGGRLLVKTGVGGGLALAGILVDLMLQTVTQALFAAVGLAVLWGRFGDRPLVRELGVGLLIAVPALAGFLAAQRLGLFALLDRGLVWLGRRMPALAAGRAPLDLQPALQALYRRRAGLARGALWHLAGWTVGIGEVWVALAGMRQPVSPAEALVLEALGQAARSAAFAVPGALGVQEGGYVLLGALFGLDPATAVALSLVKRLPDLAIGLPSLAAWQAWEASMLRRD